MEWFGLGLVWFWVGSPFTVDAIGPGFAWGWGWCSADVGGMISRLGGSTMGEGDNLSLYSVFR